MGIMTKGIPTDISLQLKSLSGACAFVETGTFEGETTRWAAGHFDKVHTIEVAESLFTQYSPALNALPGVTCWLGTSSEVLPEVVKQLPAEPVQYWLDGHWSGGITGGEDEECPLLAELQTIIQREQDVILIDDARLFLGAPMRPLDASKWPTLEQIFNVLRQRQHFPYVAIVDDVMFIVPPEQAMIAVVQEYSRDCHDRASAIKHRQLKLERSWAGRLYRLLHP